MTCARRGGRVSGKCLFLQGEIIWKMGDFDLIGGGIFVREAKRHRRDARHGGRVRTQRERWVGPGSSTKEHPDLPCKTSRQPDRDWTVGRRVADRFLEQINADRMLPSAHGKYDVNRRLEAAPTQLKQVPLLKAARPMP